MTNLLLTGPSGIGKSTLLAKIPSRVPDKTIRGTNSQVIFQRDVRVGWSLHNYEGEGGVLAHVDIESEYQLGRYGVDMELFHRIMMPQLEVDATVDLYLIDEISAIAPWSSEFMTAMDSLLDSDRFVIAIVGHSPRHPYPNEVKERDDVDLWEVQEDNRDQLLSDIVARIAG